jgi:hypothetical protein
MSTTKVWNLKYQLGATSRTASDASNPQTRKAAIEGAKNIANRNGWKVWVEHSKTGERIFDSVGSVPSEFAKKAAADVAKKELAERIAGSKFRPVTWNDISKVGCPLLGWGIEEKAKGSARYIPRALDGKVHPFTSKAKAQTKCDELNAIANPR